MYMIHIVTILTLHKKKITGAVHKATLTVTIATVIVCSLTVNLSQSL